MLELTTSEEYVKLNIMIECYRPKNPDSAEARRNSAQGFTLLEVILAIFVTSVVIALMMDVFIASAKGGYRSSNISTAVNLAQARIEEIRSLTRNDITLLPGAGSNSENDFLPALTNVSCDAYPNNFYLTESDYYQANYGTTGSLSGMTPTVRIDRITQIEWVDDPDGGTSQDYLKVTVTIFWQKGGKSTSIFLVSYVYQKP